MKKPYIYLHCNRPHLFISLSLSSLSIKTYVLHAHIRVTHVVHTQVLVLKCITFFSLFPSPYFFLHFPSLSLQRPSKLSPLISHSIMKKPSLSFYCNKPHLSLFLLLISLYLSTHDNLSNSSLLLLPPTKALLNQFKV